MELNLRANSVGTSLDEMVGGAKLVVPICLI